MEETHGKLPMTTQVAGGWCLKMAANLVMYRRNEKQFLEFGLDRLLAHPAMQAPMRKVQGDLDAHGVQGYEKYFPEGWIS